MKELVITPQGWIESIILELDYISSCGTEKQGLGISVTKNQKHAAGGVLSRQDMRKLADIFEKHLKEYPLNDL